MHYLSIYSIEIKELLEFDYENKDYQKFISERKKDIERQKKIREVKNREIQKRKKEIKSKREKLNLERVDKLLNSGIDFSKFGWVQKAANLLEMKSQKISNWMKKNMLDFYNDKCFNRDKIRNKYNLCECGLKKRKESKYCKNCYDLKQRKVERPPYKQLIEEIEELGYSATGRKYGVSDNAIRKWKTI